ncbi:MAG: LiaF transmembrane domain-containing protein [Bacteroidota bacterium]
MEVIDMNKQNENRRPKSATAIFGLILVFLGLALIGKQFNLIPWEIRNVIFTWQAFLILLGVIFITTRDNKVSGYILLGIGGFFIIPEVFDVPWEFRRLFWPSIFIIAGILILFKGSSFFRNRSYSGTGIDRLDDVNIFGGSDKIVTSKNFQGGEVVSIFGGGKYDLRNANPAKGCEMEVVNIFGGSNFLIPPDWNVKLDVVGILGGFSDKRSTVETNGDKTIHIKGVAIFGGGDIKNM